MYSTDVALNIKDAETERLAAVLAARVGVSKTAAIRQALQLQLDLVESRDSSRLSEVLEVLRTEVWPLTAGGDPISKREREEILGYNDQGFCQ